MKSLTYEGWATVGYHVRKGEVATGNDGQGNATFTREQVDDGAPVRGWHKEPWPVAEPDLLDDVEDL